MSSADAWRTALMAVDLTCPETRADVYHSLPKSRRQEVFSIDDKARSELLEEKPFLRCGICWELLCRPVVCQAGCPFVACLACLREYYGRCKGTGCPNCGAQHSAGLFEAKAISQVVEFEIEACGGPYSCNDVRPGGSHAAPLWCCRARFRTLEELLRHLGVQPSFADTLRCTLRAALADDATDRDSSRLKRVLEDRTTRSMLRDVVCDAME